MVLALFALGCSPRAPRVVVQLVTDYVPETEFDAIEVRVGSETTTVPALRDRSYDRAVRITEIELTTDATITLGVALMLQSERVQAQPRRVTPAPGVTIVTVLVTRDCENVVCPAGDAAAIACTGGRCIDPECTPETPERCPTCAGGSPVSPIACVTNECRPEGVCFGASDDARCADGERCVPIIGCMPVLANDAGPSGPDASAPTLLPEDCDHPWTITSDIQGNLTMYASRTTLLLSGNGATRRSEGHDENDGHVVWSDPGMGRSWLPSTPTGDVVAFSHSTTDASASWYDVPTGATLGTFEYTSSSGWAAYLGVRSNGEVLALASPPAIPTSPDEPWWLDGAGMEMVSGTGYAGVAVRHAADGTYLRHVVVPGFFADWPLLRPVDGDRWAMSVGEQPGPVTIGSHVVATGANELVIFTDELSFDRAHLVPDVIASVATMPLIGIRAATTSRHAIIAFDDSGELWSRADCTGYGRHEVSASDRYLYVAAATMGGDFCGVTLPVIESGFVLAQLDPRTGDALHVEWFSTGGRYQAFAVSSDDEAYVAFTIAVRVCDRVGVATGGLTIVRPVEHRCLHTLPWPPCHVASRSRFSFSPDARARPRRRTSSCSS